MTEQSGEIRARYSSERSSTNHPAIPFRKFVKNVLTDENIATNIVHAAVELGHATYCLDNQIGRPDYVESQAIKLARKQGLTDEEIRELNSRVCALYGQFKSLSTSEAKEIPEWSNEAIEHSKRLKEKSDRQKRENAKNKFRYRFERINNLTDDELKIANSNRRVDFRADTVYKSGGLETKQAIVARNLKEDRYQERMDEILAEKDELRINLDNVDSVRFAQIKIAFATNLGRYLGRGSDAELESKFRQAVLGLLSEGRASIPELVFQGLDPEMVRIKARILVGKFKLNETERVRDLTRLVRRQQYHLVGRLPGNPNAD